MEPEAESEGATERRLYLRPAEVLMAAVCIIIVTAISILMFVEGYWYVAGFGVFAAMSIIALMGWSNRVRRPIGNV